MAFEEEFKLEISDEDAEKIKTVQDAISTSARTSPEHRLKIRRPFPWRGVSS